MITILLPNVTMIQAGRSTAGERSSVELTVVTELSRRVAGMRFPVRSFTDSRIAFPDPNSAGVRLDRELKRSPKERDDSAGHRPGLST